MKRVRGERRLRAKDIAALRPGTHEEGGGPRLVVEPSGTRRWVLRVTIAGKRRNRGLGPYPLVLLDKARDVALDIRRAAREGRDLPAEQRRERAKSISFRQAFDTFFDLRKHGLSNAKHLNQWPATMEAYVFPPIGDRPVSDITHADVLAILEPIWFEKPETAKRVLQRLEAVFKSSILRGQRERPPHASASPRSLAETAATSNITARCPTPRCRPSCRRSARAGPTRLPSLPSSG